MSQLLKIKVEKGIRLVVPNNIIYVEAYNKHSIIYYDDSNKFESKHPLKLLEAKLKEPRFFRTHDSFIINCYYFESIYNLHVILKGNIKVPISRYKKRLFEENLEKYYDLNEVPYTSK